ncbi:Protein gts1 [Neophaeococcomyces mojaviensis]|uniref:Protein gts1 n=1 Tax=Neophaeococcomyces mojaviensis TaxID=3383035 RepID=A0ACC3A4C1_9EURO|nr:Protein gts1 [Knufia sp. JES_112]
MATISKREQARNERELHDLLRQPGNSVCADCGARNPSWASWNLGIFLCMRCASIHRKLGTHISKVKSLSMDKWTSEQVESMKQNGNLASNKHYNPKNKKPDIPLDADEVDSAMERFVRKKYQEKSLVDGRPEPPSRADMSPSIAQAPQPSQTPELPPSGKKHKFFGFSLRASSKKDRPGVKEAFKVTPVEYSPTSANIREVSDIELQEKLAQLRDMGFSDNERNITILQRVGGNLEQTIATLVKLGSSGPSRQRSTSPAPVARPSTTSATSSAAPAATTSNNPFDQVQRPDGFGLSFGASQQQTQLHSQDTSPSTNPWHTAMPPQQTTGLENQLSNMQLSNVLFPNTTGGYGSQPQLQQDPRLQALTPPVPSIPQQYGYAASPSSNTTNPFYQPPLSSQSTGSNPFQQMQSQPTFVPQTNPFLGMPQPQEQHSFPQPTNPFGLPPSSSPPAQQYLTSPQSPNTNPFGLPQQQFSPPVEQTQSFPFSQQVSGYGQPSPQLPNFQYGQAQQPQQSQQTSQFEFQPQQPQYLQAQQQQPSSYQYQQQFPAQQVQQAQPLQPQQTGRYTKNDIMALFSQPTSQQQPLASIPEPFEQMNHSQAQNLPQQTLSPPPAENPYGNLGVAGSKRSVTMPAAYSSMHSSGGGGSRNPFMSNPASRQASGSSVNHSPFGVQPQQPQGYRHASNESVSVNNPNLMDGRHSPDAFASLSSTYMR